MSKVASNFKRTDLKRAIQAFESAGKKLGRVEVEGKKIIIFPDSEPEEEARPNSFDQVFRR